ncbi:hypothetical protein [Comamonas testosteroni]|jgi:hypothetical protein|uniref:hypothetical protein n=1 Tax=Comamonas testosteroni TaxID=285 RepID=UPI0026EBADCD|nr:hypothetical protein [Comamonas testosteroni]
MVKTVQGWEKIEWISGGTHHYEQGYPACAWKARQQVDEQGRCLACSQAIEKAGHSTAQVFSAQKR